MTPPNLGDQYNPLTGETESGSHYPDHSGSHPPQHHEQLQRDFSTPLGQGSPGMSSSLAHIPMRFNLVGFPHPRCERMKIKLPFKFNHDAVYRRSCIYFANGILWDAATWFTF